MHLDTPRRTLSRSHKRRSFAACLLLVALGGCGTPAYEQDYRRMPQTSAGVEEYLRKYPASPYSEQLRTKLPQLANEERERRQRADAERAAAIKRGAVAWNMGNYAEALSLAKEALAQGDPKANFVLAIIYWNGQGVDPDYERALTHMRASGSGDESGSLARVMQSAIECSKKKASYAPAMKVPRNGLSLVNDGTCVRLGMNPVSID